jgi:hypothetical protein
VIARLAIGLALAITVTSTAAIESTDWPPSPETLARMRELQSKIGDPAATKDEREGAKRDLERLMKIPGAPERKGPEAKKPARAAIEPFPSVAAPFEYKPLREPPPTARLEVVDDPPQPPAPPRKPVIDPATGRLIQPTSPGAAVDPRTGRILQETPAGYIDPRTGRLIPK